MAYPSNSDSVNGDQLRAFIERVERMQEERKAISDDIAEIYAEAKGNGFDTKVMRTIVRIRAQDHAERMEQEALLELYMTALGMQSAPSNDDDYQPRAHAPARTRENIEQFPAETGDDEDNEPAPPATPEESGGPSAVEGAGVALPADTQSTAAERRSAETDATLVVMPHADGSIGSERHGESVPVDTINPGGENANSVGNADASHSPDDSETPEPGAPAAAETAHTPISGAVTSNVTTFVRKPHDGPVSSKGLPRHKLCLHVDLCGGTWRVPCFDCQKAAAQQIAVEAGGVQIPHRGEVA